MLAATLFGLSSQALSQSGECDVRIAQTTLGDALNALAKQCGASVLYPYDLGRTRGIQPVEGRHTISEALRVMLRNTPFIGEVTASGVITISTIHATGETDVLQSNRTTFLGSISALALSLGAAPARAADRDSTPQLEEIVVTATKREVSEQQVAGGITALSGNALQEQGILSYDDLVRSVPGVIDSGASNTNKFVIRGIETSNTTSSSGEQKLVTIYLDDLPLTTFSVITPDVQPYDISRVEVLRGPQGTLFGAGSMAGAIRYITNKPDDTGYHASVDVDFGAAAGSDYRERVSAMANIPLIEDRLALRIVGTFRNQDGYIDEVSTGRNGTNWEQDWGLRAALRWKATDSFVATLTVIDNENHSGDGGLYDPALGLHKSAAIDPFALTTGLNTVNLLLEGDLGFANLISSSTYAHAPNRWHLDLDAIDPLLRYYEQSPTDSVVQEIRLVSKTEGPFEWVAGVYYLRQDSSFAGAVYIPKVTAEQMNITGGISNLSGGIEGDDSIIARISSEAAIFGECLTS